MLQAMNTGHDGSLTTIHANSPRDALHRLEMLVLMAGVELPLKAIREQIACGFDLIVHISRLVDGSRRVTPHHRGRRHGRRRRHAPGPVRGPLGRASGRRDAARCSSRCARPDCGPDFLSKLAANGVELPPRPGWETHEPREPRRPRRAALAVVLAGGRDAPARRDPPGRPRRFPLVRLTALVPTGTTPTLTENGRPVNGRSRARARLGRGARARRRPLAVDAREPVAGGQARGGGVPEGG